jgi:TetR/AcrR family tetracycline transcriptional repressor
MALSREQVARAAIEVADTEGLGAVTMRRVGRALGVEAMSLYRYVTGKDDLMDAVHEHLLAALPPPGTGDWSRVLVAQADAFRALLAAHPNLVVLFATRPARAPGAEARVEALLAPLAAGLDEDAAVWAFQLVFAFVVGHAMFHLSGGADDASARAEFAWGLETLVVGIGRRVADRSAEGRVLSGVR